MTRGDGERGQRTIRCISVLSSRLYRISLILAMNRSLHFIDYIYFFHALLNRLVRHGNKASPWMSLTQFLVHVMQQRRKHGSKESIWDMSLPSEVPYTSTEEESGSEWSVTDEDWQEETMEAHLFGAAIQDDIPR
jgi:hypothetical protein